MKKQIELKQTWFLLTMLLVLFTACQKDNEPSIGNKKLTFVLPSPKPFVQKTTGLGDENGGSKDKIAFYQFSKDNKYEHRYLVNYGDAISTDDKTRTYSLDINDTGGGEKHFVIVQSANAEDFLNMTAGKSVNELLNSKTVERKGILSAPFVMSNAKSNDKGYILIPDIDNVETPIKVELKRRLARFDMLNDSNISGLVINKIYIKNRRTQGFIGDIDGEVINISTDILEIPAESLSNGGTSFYLYPTILTSIIEQDTQTAVWATTKLAGTNTDGPKLYLDLGTDVRVEANRLYKLNVRKVAGSLGFDITVADWTDGTSLDWISVDDGLFLMDDKAKVTEGTEIKGTHVKITADTPIPYTITKVKTDNNPINKEAFCDGDLPSWLSTSANTTFANNGTFRHEIVYTIKERPTKEDLFAITYLTGSTSDEDLLVIGFTDPYPGTPLPCLSWGDKLYSPTHAKQTTYLVHNNTDEAYFCGNKGYTFNKDMSGISNDVKTNPCPSGWAPLNDKEAEDYVSWVGGNLKRQITEKVYTYRWFEGDKKEATDIRILAGYPKAVNPTIPDIATFGTWPNVAWIAVRDLKVTEQAFGNEWVVTSNYGIPYRCIRNK